MASGRDLRGVEKRPTSKIDPLGFLKGRRGIGESVSGAGGVSAVL
jgi:hypothetical protein